MDGSKNGTGNFGHLRPSHTGPHRAGFSGASANAAYGGGRGAQKGSVVGESGITQGNAVNVNGAHAAMRGAHASSKGFQQRNRRM